MSRLFVEQLTVVDCSYLHRDRGLLGESWIVDIELQGELNDQGMVFDFGEVKRSIKAAIDEFADHKLIVPVLAPQLKRLEKQDDYIELEFSDNRGRRFYHRSPAQAVCLLETGQVNIDSLRKVISDKVRELLPGNVTDAKVLLRTERSEDPVYQYSHGLKKHNGNCQRIAHGHRSRIVIWEDGLRSRKWENFWADKWRDIYLASREDCVSDKADFYRFSYTAAQGEFSIELPKTCCYLIDPETTVEHIAAHVAEELHKFAPHAEFTVRLFEGVNKGAIAQSPAHAATSNA